MHNRIKTGISYVPTLAALYAVCLVLSNVMSNKLVSFFSTLTIDGGFLFFPITYIINDIVTETYGYKISRKIIWIGFFTAVLAAVGIYVVTILPPSPEWVNQQAFATTFELSGRLFCASLLSYLVGEFINSFTLARLKVYTRGKYIAGRFIISSIVGAAIENFLFYLLAFYGHVPLEILFQMMTFQYLLKIGYETIMLPLSCCLANKLKKLDGVDHYDDKTNFNPISV